MTPKRMQTELEHATRLLTPLGYRGTHNDLWQLDRARWLHRNGHEAEALEQLVDMNALRSLHQWEGKPNMHELPVSCLDEELGDDTVLGADPNPFAPWRDPAYPLGEARRRLTMAIDRLEVMAAETEGGNLSEVYDGALAYAVRARISVEASLTALNPETAEKPA